MTPPKRKIQVRDHSRDLEPVHLDNGDPSETAAGVEIRRTKLGRGVIVPRSLRDMSGEAAEAVADLQGVVGEIENLQNQLDLFVNEARGHGVSWDGIGWCVGTTGEAARQRWGT
jgi:hypothetical protein